MGLFYTQIVELPEISLAASDTKLGAALRANGVAFDVHELSESDRRFWQRSKDVAEDMRVDFEGEGDADLMHLGETDAVLDLIPKGLHARYLYHARVR
jgi:hypothetical protein